MNAQTIIAPAAGRLLGWIINGLPEVTAGALLGEVEDATGARHEIRATAAGRFRPLAARGAIVEAGAPLASLDGASAPRAITPSAPPRPVERRLERQSPPAAPVVEELELDPPAAPVRAVERAEEHTEPAAPRARPRTRHATYHITDDQRGRLSRCVLELRLAGGELGNVTESEAVRAALELLLSLPGEALAATLHANRRRERAGKYGVGYPRPGKGKGRG